MQLFISQSDMSISSRNILCVFVYVMFRNYLAKSSFICLLGLDGNESELVLGPSRVRIQLSPIQHFSQSIRDIIQLLFTKGFLKLLFIKDTQKLQRHTESSQADTQIIKGIQTRTTLQSSEADTQARYQRQMRALFTFQNVHLSDYEGFLILKNKIIKFHSNIKILSGEGCITFIDIN